LSSILNKCGGPENKFLLGFTDNGEYIVFNEESTIKFYKFNPQNYENWISECDTFITIRNYPQNIILMKHNTSFLSVTLQLFIDNIDDTLLKSGALRIFMKENLIYERLLLAQQNGHAIYDTQDMDYHIIVIHGGFQILIYIVQAPSNSIYTCNNIPISQARGKSDNCMNYPKHCQPCRSRWWWKSDSLCSCSECLYFKNDIVESTTHTATTTSTSSSHNASNNNDGSSTNNANTLNSISNTNNIIESAFHCEHISEMLLYKYYYHNIYTQTHVTNVETRVVGIKEYFISISHSKRYTRLILLVIVLGMTVSLNNTSKSMIWVTHCNPINGDIYILKVEDLYSLHKNRYHHLTSTINSESEISTCGSNVPVNQNERDDRSVSSKKFLLDDATDCCIVDNINSILSLDSVMSSNQQHDSSTTNNGFVNNCSVSLANYLRGNCEILSYMEGSESLQELHHPTLPYVIYNDENDDHDMNLRVAPL
jgi:hypothetical protein